VIKVLAAATAVGHAAASGGVIPREAGDPI